MNRTMGFIFLTLTINLTLLAAGADSGSPERTAPSQKEALEGVLTKQQSAWNQGDVVAFMQGYWNSTELTFAGTGGITRGYALVLAHYKQDYPNQATMGHLEFSELEVHALGNNAALVLGKWHLARKTGDVGGVFSLVFQRFPDGWKIVHDHTSQVAPEHP